MATCARCDSILGGHPEQPHVCLAIPQSTTAPEPLAQCRLCGAFGPAGAPCGACLGAPSTLDPFAVMERMSREEAELGYPAGEPMTIDRSPRPVVLARVTGRVRSVLEGRARLHLDEQPVAWEGAEAGQEIEVVVMARGRR